MFSKLIANQDESKPNYFKGVRRHRHLPYNYHGYLKRLKYRECGMRDLKYLREQIGYRSVLHCKNLVDVHLSVYKSCTTIKTYAFQNQSHNCLPFAYRGGFVLRESKSICK